MEGRYRIQLLGSLRIEQGDRSITRFRTRKTGALLAFLAFYREHAHSREVLIETLWPEEEPNSARQKLRLALTSLRHQLEPPGIPAGAVLITNRSTVQLNPAAASTDVDEFAGMLQRATGASSGRERLELLTQAVELYRGELLPGYFEGWVVPERQRLAEAYLQALGQLIRRLEQDRDFPRALAYARRAVSADPLREESHRELMRLLAASGQPSAALQQYRELERVLHEVLGETPDAASRQLAQHLEDRLAETAASAVSLERSAPPAAAPSPTLEKPSASGLVSPPVGTVTFLLTDIESSTAGWEKSGEELRDALARSHAALRREFRQHGGYEFGEAGDSFVVAFAGAGPALACAVAGQRALAAEPWPSGTASEASARGPIRVRMALHTGDVELEEDGYRDLVLHHASRLLLAAHDGQILVSEITAGLLSRNGEIKAELGGSGIRLVDLGVYRLRDIATPQRLFQASYPEMSPAEFPPPRAEHAFKSNLPLQFTRFFGRREEIARLVELLGGIHHGAGEPLFGGGRAPGEIRRIHRDAQDGQDDRVRTDRLYYPVHPVHPCEIPSEASVSPCLRGDFERDPAPAPRLVTLTGLGGSGKTRLALEVAERLVEPFRGAVWFVPLADLRDSGLIADGILNALRLPRSPQASPLEQITDALSEQPALLVLDNFEHLVEGAGVIRTLLERVPTLQCFVASRQSLGLEGEREVPLLPMPVPGDSVLGVGYSVLGSRVPNTQHPTPEALTLYDSVQLFIDRAQAVRPDFQVTNANAAAVAALCQRLEGIPLAIELAAARARNLSPMQILAHLERRLDFLASQRRDAPSRHRTLRAAIDGSYEQLPPALQRFFARLSVFHGGWTIEAAEAVCEEPLALDYLTQLQECSLILAEEGPPGMRFRMLEMLREYARDRLRDDERSGLKRRHLQWYLALAEAAEYELERKQKGKWIGRLQTERENLRAALQRGLDSEPDLALRLAGALGPFWVGCAYYSEGWELAGQALQRAADAPADLRAKALHTAGSLAVMQGDYAQARELLERSLTIGRSLGDRHRTAGTLAGLTWVAWCQGDYPRARALGQESLATWRQVGDSYGIARLMGILGTVAGSQGDKASQRGFYEQSLALYRQLDDQWEVAGVLHNLSLATAGQDPALSLSLVEESLALFRELGDEMAPRYNLIHMGRLACRRGEHAAGRDCFEGSLEICLRLGDKRLIVECLHGLAEAAIALGPPERAARLLGAAKALQEAIGFAFWGKYDPYVSTLCEVLGETAFSTAWGVGQAMTWQQAADYALGGSRHS